MNDCVYSIIEIQEKLLPIFKNYTISKAYVFGSYSRGGATGRSDIDIIVEPDEGFRPQRVCGILDEAMEALDKNVDVYSIKEFKPDSEILPQILKDRIILYDKSI